MLEVFNVELINKLKEYYIKDGVILSKKLWYSAVCKLFPEFKETFEKHFNVSNFREIMYCILTDTNEIPKCKNPNCNNKVPLRNYVIGFQQCCCKQCIAEYQKTSEEFRHVCSEGEKRHQKAIHKETFIDFYDYEYAGN